jgi:hypothetical protein
MRSSGDLNQSNGSKKDDISNRGKQLLSGVLQIRRQCLYHNSEARCLLYNALGIGTQLFKIGLTV